MCMCSRVLSHVLSQVVSHGQALCMCSRVLSHKYVFTSLCQIVVLCQVVCSVFKQVVCII